MSELVGRDAELASLVSAVDRTAGGSGRMVLLRGEAGIGKSRLAAELVETAAARQFTVLTGRAHPLHTGLAYAPIVEALRPVIDTLAGQEISQLPDLRRLIPHPRLPETAPLDDPELERTRMFEAAAQLVRFTARRGSVLLFIDDLHWADRGTVELLHYIGREAPEQRLMILATYRAGEAEGSLRELAMAVRRADQADEISLTPLTDSAVARLTAAVLGEQPQPRLLKNVTARARGVPLFVTALVHSGHLRADRLPVIVRDVVVSRLHRLDDDHRRLLEIIAVAGPSCSDQVLGHICDQDTLDGLRDLIRDGLVDDVAGQPPHYRVAHPLYAEVAYAELTGGERRTLHAKVATAIEKIGPDDVLALAPHYRAAGNLLDPTRTAEVLAAAGNRALGVGSGAEAVEYLRAAIDAMPEGRATIPLLSGLARAYSGLGDLDAAARTVTDGIAAAKRFDDDSWQRMFEYRLALLNSERGIVPDVGEKVIDLSHPSDDVAESAFVNVVTGLRHGTIADAQRHADQMVEFAATHPGETARAVGHYGQALHAMIDRDFALATSEIEECKALMADSPTSMVAGGMSRWLFMLSILAGDLRGAVEQISVRDAMKRLRLDVPSSHASTAERLAMAHYLTGDLDAALDESSHGLEYARNAKISRSLARGTRIRAILLAERGETESPMDTTLTEPSIVVYNELLDAVVAFQFDRDDMGLPVVPDPLLLFNDPLATCLRVVFAGYPSREKAAEAGKWLREIGRTAPFADALADLMDGVAYADHQLLTTAIERLTAMEMHFLAAQAQLWFARIAPAPRAQEAVKNCLATFERAGAARWLDRARQVARTLGVRAPTGRKTGELTKREAQIARLVADGLPNREIAARLFLSERTVETHLRNIYARLELPSRLALVRWATEKL
ncbi:ATP-binding protein [Fodinicola acaciae]|uniref:ATP-binding protein n=1 Tax=Fodinicola acaciae TaxID=2681555 RepID=UPI0013D6467B|nr:LuxR family transcriptional regulator [Fodinicola acaciae]